MIKRGFFSKYSRDKYVFVRDEVLPSIEGINLENDFFHLNEKHALYEEFRGSAKKLIVPTIRNRLTHLRDTALRYLERNKGRYESDLKRDAKENSCAGVQGFFEFKESLQGPKKVLENNIERSQIRGMFANKGK